MMTEDAMQAELSIVLVNYRGWRRLGRCLEALGRLGEVPFRWEAVVVDNGSDDGELESFRRRFPWCAFHESPGNWGFAHGCNAGAARASGRHLLFLNPDTEVDAAALTALWALAEGHPEYGVLSCGQRDDRGRDTRPYGSFPSLANLTGVHRWVQRRWHGIRGDQAESGGGRAGDGMIFPDWVSGALVWMRREAFERLGGWCEDYWLYFEDVDLCRRVRDAGGRVALATGIEIRHNHGGATRSSERIKAITKWEVRIARHVYVQRHFAGWRRGFAQGLLVTASLAGHLVTGTMGALLVWVPAMRVRARIAGHMLGYYAGALRRGTWLSPRSPTARRAGWGRGWVDRSPGRGAGG